MRNVYLSAAVLLALGGAFTQSSSSAAVSQGQASVVPAPWAVEDPADSLYRAARDALNRNDYTRAADLFRKIRDSYPKSQYTPDAYYWEAFALYRRGNTSDLKTALSSLEQQEKKYPKAATRGDARTLATRISGELAKRGDPASAAKVDSQAKAATQGCPDPDDEDDVRIAALNGLLQMDADRAIPILKKVLARRDPCSEALRRKAVFLVSQKHSAETESILLAAARTDPDDEVREQAVFWLSQTGSETAVSALDSILRSSKDPELQKKAIFSLSQMDSPRASAIIRSYAERTDASSEVQEQAIFWIGQHDSPENAAFLRSLYKRLSNEELKEKVIFSLSQMGGQDNGKWLMDLATDETEPIEMRKKALFWAGQTGTSITDLINLYGRAKNSEIKEQLIFVYSQRGDKASMDKLLDIAKNEPDKELKKKAIFWLSQSDDPRAAGFLQSIIDQ
ncbi:MAG TPA: HEAT repeat domain-containing protein [Gemmatimonadales bacterium]|nr:HEAT repeat domain-containing protein [Gemmatimonadales bacterium]